MSVAENKFVDATNLSYSSSSELEHLPGMTRRVPGPGDTVKPCNSIVSVKPLFERNVILIATASISDGNIFNNGLYQNCFLLYRLIEAIGWMPIFVVNEKPKTLDGISEILRTCRVADLEDIIKRPLPVKVYLEVGMSISPNLRHYMKMLGARTCKLYLGNILNIDAETPMFFPGMMFSHHVIGEQQEIWTSPHYGQNAEYAAFLNQIEPEVASMKIAPYVWDPCIITDDGRRFVQWRNRRADEKITFLIMEPNISLQKSGLIPILIAEEYRRANPEKDVEVIVLNAERLTMSGYYRASIEPCLTLAKQDRIKYSGRNDMVAILKAYPHAIPICHHTNNEFNYMVLEFLYAGFPVVHNCRAWETFGYYYPENDTRVGSKQLEEVLGYHHERTELYKSHARALTWRHSIYNPDIQKAWLDLLHN
jgi:hypothetical protein